MSGSRLSPLMIAMGDEPSTPAVKLSNYHSIAGYSDGKVTSSRVVFKPVGRLRTPTSILLKDIISPGAGRIGLPPSSVALMKLPGTQLPKHVPR